MIRLMEFNDINDIIKIEEETLNESLGFNMLNDILTNDIMKAYVYIENKVLGYISVSFDGNTLEILNFCVDKNNQGKSIGKKLLNYAIINAFKEKCKNVILDVRKDNNRAINLYESFGFKLIHTRKNYYKDSCDALVYELKLNDYNLVIDKELLISSKYIETKDYIKYYDDYQFDKYYHNFYKLNNLDKINEIIKKNINKPFLCFEYDKDFNIEGFMEKDVNIVMAAFIKSLNIKTNNNGIINIVDKNNIEEVSKFLYEDSLEYGEEYSKKNTKRMIDFILDNNSYGFIIKEDNKIIGFINAYIENDICDLEDFFILDEYQRKGYGSNLFKYALDFCKNKGCNIVTLVADDLDTPKEMYKKWGLIEIEKTYFIRRGK